MCGAWGVLSPRTETYSWEPPVGRPLEFARSQHDCSLGASLLLIALKLSRCSNVISSGRMVGDPSLCQIFASETMRGWPRAGSCTCTHSEGRSSRSERYVVPTRQ